MKDKNGLSSVKVYNNTLEKYDHTISLFQYSVFEYVVVSTDFCFSQLCPDVS